MAQSSMIPNDYALANNSLLDIPSARSDVKPNTIQN